MTQPTNEQVVQQIYSAFQRGDITGVLNALAADVSWEYPGPSNIPYAGSFRGVDAVARYFDTYGATATNDPNNEDPKKRVGAFGVESTIAQGDQVVVLGFEVSKVNATGKYYNAPFAHVWTLANGKVTRFYGYYDTAAMSASFS